MTTYTYSFYQEFDASAVDTSEGWHHMKVEVETLEDSTTAFTCYYDGAMLGTGAYIDTSADRLAHGQYGVFAFGGGSAGLPGYFDNLLVYGGTIIEDVPHVPVAIEPGPGSNQNIPVSFALLQNYPNPFNPSTKIEFQVQQAAQVSLSVYNLNGQFVRTLMDGYLTPRHYSVVWDGRDMTGRLVPSGVYLYRLTDGMHHESKRMILLK
jgi:hypothetical protein